MINKQNIAQFFALIIMTTTLSINTPVYAGKKTGIFKMLTGAAICYKQTQVVYNYLQLYRLNPQIKNLNMPTNVAISLATIYAGYALSKEGYNNFKALKNPDAQTDTKAIEFVS